MTSRRVAETSIATYATRLRGKLDLQSQKQFGQPGYNPPPLDVQEEQYQKQLLQGYQLYVGKGTSRRKNVCEVCFQARNRIGRCGCSED